MFKWLRGKRGQAELAAPIFWGVCVLLATATLTLPQIKDPFRERKAVELCYCTQSGGTEYECKAEGTEINVQEGETLDICESAVASMSKEEILDYIKDDVVLVSEDDNT